jgi:hypothetical protein
MCCNSDPKLSISTHIDMLTRSESGTALNHKVKKSQIPLTLGRSQVTLESNPQFIGLADAKSISRAHAEIDWDAPHQSFRIKCVGKNLITVDSSPLNQGESKLLGHNSAIRIGVACFYFGLPACDKASHMKPKGSPGGASE